MKWTDDKVTYLRDHYKQGLSASQIAHRLSLSRSAIIGKAHREGLCKPVLITDYGTALTGPHIITLGANMYADLTKPHGQRIFRRGDNDNTR